MLVLEAGQLMPSEYLKMIFASHHLHGSLHHLVQLSQYVQNFLMVF